VHYAVLPYSTWGFMSEGSAVVPLVPGLRLKNSLGRRLACKEMIRRDSSLVLESLHVLVLTFPERNLDPVQTAYGHNLHMHGLLADQNS